MKKQTIILIVVLCSLILITGCITHKDTSNIEPEKDFEKQPPKNIVENTIYENDNRDNEVDTVESNNIDVKDDLKEIKTKQGFILSGDILRQVAESIANDKGWDFLIVDSTNPIKIREEIIKFTESTKYDYMLILGNDEIIPIEKEGILNPKYLPNEHLQNALDQLYYGNINDDAFVELAVGRIPFNSKVQIEKYFSYNQKQFGQNFKIFSYPSIGSFTTGKVKSGFEGETTAIIEDPSKSLFLNNLKTQDMIAIYTHGNDNSVKLNDDENLLSNDVPQLNNAPLVFVSACSAARGLGLEIMEQGATAYVGFYATAIPNPNVMPLFDEESLGKSIKKDVNQHIARSEAGLIDRGGFPSLFVLYGDPSIKIEQKTYDDFIIIKEDKDYRIDIPSFKVIETFEGNLKSIIATPPYHVDFRYYKKAIEILGTGKYYEFDERKIVPFSDLLNDNSIPSSEGKIIENGFFIPLDEDDEYFSEEYKRVLHSPIDAHDKVVLSEINLAKLLSPYDSAVYYPGNGDAITYVFETEEDIDIEDAYWMINSRIIRR
jgi:hypothetical protein